MSSAEPDRTAPNRAVPFLAAFNAIEGFLRDALGAKKSDSFAWMARLAAKRGVLTHDQAETLQEYAELRNAISHGEYGLLTTNAIARWVAAELDADRTLPAASVAEVLEHSGKLDEPVFLPRTVTAAMAMEALSTPLPSGAVPRLAIVTEHGKPTEKPISVLGATDIPALSQAA